MGRQLGLYLREKRKEAGMTTMEVVNKAGISKGMVNYMESGNREPSFETIIRFATAVGITDLSETFRVYATEQAQIALAILNDSSNKECVELVQKWLAGPKDMYPEFKAYVKDMSLTFKEVTEKLEQLEAILERNNL